MNECQLVLDVLPQYVAGDSLPDREFVSLHLLNCEACDEAYRDLKSVFALLEALPEPPPVAPYAEKNAQLALRTLVAPGPLRTLEFQRRRENLKLAVCSILSLTGAAGVTAVALTLMNADLSLNDSFKVNWQMVMKWLPQNGIWRGIIAFLLMGGVTALLTALILNAPASGGRRFRREI